MIGTGQKVTVFLQGSKNEKVSTGFWGSRTANNGPTDLLAFDPSLDKDEHNASNWPPAKLLGGPVQENKELTKRANPITYVTEDDPRF